MMDSTLYFFLWCMCLLTKSCCEDVELSTPTEFQYLLLTRYGYTFNPSPQTNVITFQVKACGDVVIGLFESEDDLMKAYKVLIGGWNNGQTAIGYSHSIHVRDFPVNREEKGVVSCNEYRSFWISWRNNGEVVLGRGEVVFHDVFLTMRDDKYLYQVRFVGISTGWGNSGEWKILRLYSQSWRVEPMFKNIRMTSGIKWTVEAKNPGDCAIKCRQLRQCVSFVFNAEKQNCQAHNQHFKNVTEGQGHVEQGSHYFTRT